MTPQTVLFVMLAPIVIGLVQAFKKAGLDPKFAPLAAVVLGVAGAIVVTIGSPILVQALFVGVATGLGAVGLYSGGQIALPMIRNQTPGK